MRNGQQHTQQMLVNHWRFYSQQEKKKERKEKKELIN